MFSAVKWKVYVSGRIKTMNESIYYTVDAIHNAISENKKNQIPILSMECKKKKWNSDIMEPVIMSIHRDFRGTM